MPDSIFISIEGAEDSVARFTSLGRAEALPRVMRNRGIMSFISGEQGNTSPKMKAIWEQM